MVSMVPTFQGRYQSDEEQIVYSSFHITVNYRTHIDMRIFVYISITQLKSLLQVAEHDGNTHELSVLLQNYFSFWMS